jgi:ABC-type transport system involved in cytochrome c biogenesis permease subunit
MHDVVSALLAGGAVLYLAAWTAFLASKRKAGHALLGAAWTLNAGLFALNAAAAGAPPFGNMYHVQVVLALCFPPLCVVLARRWQLGWTAGYFACAAALPLMGAFFMDRDMHWRRMPALQSPWFVPHVLAYMLAYAMAAIAFALLAVKRLRQLLRRPGGPPDYDEGAAVILRLAFPFMTFGLMSGALWAEEAWGAYWSWDPKETWSLITWMLYAVYFHCRLSARLRKAADLAHLLAFLCLLATFLLVNLLPRLGSVLHGYA